VLSKLSHAVTDSYETDLGGPALSPDVAPFVVARSVWGKDDSKDIAIDRFTAQLHPCNDGVPGNKEVVWFLCQPFALARVALLNPINPISLTEYIASLVPLSDPVRVPAGPGTAAQDYVFSFSDRSVTGPGHTIVTLSRKPRPKSIQPVFEQSKGALEHDQSATTFWFVWAVKADGSAAGNVGWARNTAVTEVVNGSRKLRTVQVRRDNSNWAIEGPSTMGAAPRPVFRCSIQCGSYAAAELDYTGGGNLIDLTAAPTQTVMFVAIAGVPDGTGSVFEVRNDADSAWLPFLDGQTAAEVGVSQRQTYKVRWRGSPNAQGDASPTFWEMGARDLAKTWLSDLVASVKARWAIPNVAELVPQIPEVEIVLIKNGEKDFADRVTKLLSTNYAGSLAFRVWRGDPSRPRSEWLHKDDFTLLDDYDPREADATIIAHSPLVFVNGALPVYNTTSQQRTPLQFANKTPKQVYDEIVGNQLAADIPARYRGEGIIDESCIITKLIDASDGLTELNAIAHIADVALSTSAGRLKSFPMGVPGTPQVIFPSAKILWRSTGPGLRQRVPRFFVKYDYDTLAQKFNGEARCISGNDILATNLQPSRIDAVTELRDDVGRWIPTEELAKRVGQRRVNRLGAGMLVWSFTSTEPHPELELGDVVAVETERFFARDPSQTQQRTLKGALWALARVVDYDIEGKEFSVWIQSYTDIFGSSDSSILIGYVTPIVTAIQLHVDDSGAVKGNIAVTDGEAVRIAVSTAGVPADATARAAALQVLDSNGQLSTATLASIVPGEFLYAKVFAYERADGTGVESLAATGVTPKGYRKRTFVLDDGLYLLAAQTNDGMFTADAVRFDPANGVYEGGSVYKIYRHREEITVNGADTDGDVPVTFAQVYQNVPMILLKGGQYVSYSPGAGLGSAVKQRLRIQSVDATASGFTSRAQIAALGVTTSQTDDFASGNNIGSVGATAEVDLQPGGANDDKYTINYRVSVTVDLNAGALSTATLVVAIDTNDGVGGWIERATFSYATSNLSGPPPFEANTATWDTEAKQITVTGLGTGDDIRIRAKSFTVNNGGTGSFSVRGADAGGANPDTRNGCLYTTAADTIESAIPAAGDSVVWSAQEVI
jgi:hypothetical protein